MQFPRFTTRRLMVLVVAVATIFAVYVDRRTHFQRLANHHWEIVVANSVGQKIGDRTIYEPGPSLRKCQLAA